MSLDSSLITGGKKCFGTYNCWNNVKRKCPVAINCKLKRLAEQKKKPKVIILDDNPLSIASYLEEFGESNGRKK